MILFLFFLISNIKIEMLLKISFSEKATKIWRNRPQGFDVT